MSFVVSKKNKRSRRHSVFGEIKHFSAEYMRSIIRTRRPVIDTLDAEIQQNTSENNRIILTNLIILMNILVEKHQQQQQKAVTIGELVT